MNKSSPLLHLRFLDGIRGLAALYVVLYHAQAMIREDLPRRVSIGLFPLELGRFSVTIFIVLSGYCLMLPIARSADQQLRGGFAEYIKRRSRRILPPYYAALVLSFLPIITFPHLHPYNVNKTLHTLNDFTYPTILSHLLLLDNMYVGWANKINSPMWSVATEFQIYLLFPSLLIPLWKRFGLIAMVVIGFIIGLIPFFVFHLSDLCSPWFLGVFATGVAGAVISFSDDNQVARLRESLPWDKVAAAIFLLFFVVILGVRITGSENAMRENFRWVLEMIVGLGTTCIIIYCTKHCVKQTDLGSPSDTKPWLLRLLESRVAITVGLFSYSLYLIHNPLLELVPLQGRIVRLRNGHFTQRF